MFQSLLQVYCLSREMVLQICTLFLGKFSSFTLLITCLFIFSIFLHSRIDTVESCSRNGIKSTNWHLSFWKISDLYLFSFLNTSRTTSSHNGNSMAFNFFYNWLKFRVVRSIVVVSGILRIIITEWIVFGSISVLSRMLLVVAVNASVIVVMVALVVVLVVVVRIVVVLPVSRNVHQNQEQGCHHLDIWKTKLNFQLNGF